MNNMTELKEFRMYKPGEIIPAVRLTDYPGERSIVVVHEEKDNFDLTIAPVVEPTYLVGPIVDKLYAYEQLGDDPVKIKIVIENRDNEIDYLKERVRVKDACIRKLLAENEELLATLDEYQGCFGDDPRAGKKYLMELDEKCCELRRVEKNLHATIKIRDAQIDELRDHTNNQRKQIEAQAETIRKYREENKELTTANEGLKEEVRKAVKHRESTIHDLMVKNQSLEEHNKLQNAGNLAMKLQVSVLKGDHEKLKEENDKLKKCNAYLEGVAIGADKLKAEYIKMEGNKNSQILELIAENAKLKEELELRDKLNEELFKENKKLRLSDIAYRYEGF